MDVFCFSVFYARSVLLLAACISRSRNNRFPKKAGVFLKAFFFGSSPWNRNNGKQRDSKKLSNEQLKVVKDYFELERERLLRRMDTKGLQVVDRDTVDPHIEAALETLKKECESRELLTGHWS